MDIEASSSRAAQPAGIRYVDMNPRTPVRFEFTATGQFIRATQSHVGGADDMSGLMDPQQLADMRQLAQERIRLVSAYEARYTSGAKTMSVDVADLQIRGGGFVK